jgi:serine protease Do
MGFYDEFETKPKRKGNLSSWVAVALVSALIGSGTTVALVPTLIKSNVISTSGGSNSLAPTSNSGNGVKPQNVSVSVNSGVTDAVNAVKPAVVGVLNMQKTKDFFGNQSKSEQEAGTGSGILFDKAGHIVTNNHVVEGADEVEVSINDKKVKATVVGTDPITDLAVIKVDPNEVKDLVPANFGNSDTLNIGEPAIAIGNPLGMKFAQTVTVGVISATNRDMPVQDEQTGQDLYSQTVLQTDAAINPGNSGGALVNIKGEVIGINSAKIATTGVEGIGFAIPINEARPIIQQLMDSGKVIRPALGISGYSLAEVPEYYRPNVPTDTGILVEKTQDGAAKAGLDKGDVIVAIDGKKVEDQVELRKQLFTHKPGDKVKVDYYRGKDKKTVEVTLSGPSK